jgi:hypothetical protein
MASRFTVLESLLQRLACARTRGDGSHAATVAGMAFHQRSTST